MNPILETIDPKNLNNKALIFGLRRLVASERKITAEILTYIKEVDRRKLYFDYKCTSLFGFLTSEIGYTNSAAQRRIESARLLVELPEIKKDLESGALNLSQVSMVAQSVRQKDREREQERKKELKNRQESKNSESSEVQPISPLASQLKTQDTRKEIFELIKNKNLDQSQKIIAQILDLKIKAREKKILQKDESVRIVMTLSKDQAELFKRVKELISHKNPNPSMADLFELLAKDYIQRKDPLIKKVRIKKQDDETNVKAVSSEAIRETEKIAEKIQAQEAKLTAATVVAHRTSPQRSQTLRKPIKISIRREIFQRDQCCQWKTQDTGKICGSRFQLQIDHKLSVWRGGGNETANLHVLCRTHNTLKYEREMMGQIDFNM